MTSEKQIQANIQNAQLGGVKTDEGKATSRFNAVKHGILRQSLTTYEKELYPHLLDELLEELNPVGVLEMILVGRIALCYLRLFRVAKAEKEFMLSTLNPTITENLFEGLGPKVIEKGYEPVVDVSVIRNLDHTILRYETTIERSLYKAIHELQRIQAARLGNKSPLPLAVDVIVDRDEQEYT